MTTDHSELISEARAIDAEWSWRDVMDTVRALADELEAASVERAVVEAQALEQAADALATAAALIAQTIGANRTTNDAAEYVGFLRRRAVEIREGRQ